MRLSWFIVSEKTRRPNARLNTRCCGHGVEPKPPSTLKTLWRQQASRARTLPRLIQKLLGHTQLETTAIYMDLVGEEAREEVLAAW